MSPTVRLAFAAAAAWAVAMPALAAPLLLIDGGDKFVVVVDMGSRGREGDMREASVYRGEIAEPGKPRQISGERHVFDCANHRERVVATLSRQPGEAPLHTPVDGPWRPIVWKTPMDFANSAVCLDVFNREKLSSKPDVPSMLQSLERVWQPGPYQPMPKPVEPPKRRRSLLHPF